MKPILIGITGNIGSGKSRLLSELKKLDIFVIEADAIAKEILYTEENKEILQSLLGKSILKNNEYDFNEIRRIIFSDKKAKKGLEQIAAGKVWQRIQLLLSQSKKYIVFIENAVLFEQGWQDYFNLIVCIHCSQEESIRRVTASRNISEEEVNSIIHAKFPIEDKIKLSDISIDTTNFKKEEKSKSLEYLIEAVQELF